MNSELPRNFLHAAQALADALLIDVQARDREMGRAVAHAIEHGERLSLAFVFDKADPRIELDCCNDYGSRRPVASIPLQAPEESSRGH